MITEIQLLACAQVSAHGMATAEALALRVGRHGGAALIMDYGRDAPYGDSLMAIRYHKGVEVGTVYFVASEAQRCLRCV